MERFGYFKRRLLNRKVVYAPAGNSVKRSTHADISSLGGTNSPIVILLVGGRYCSMMIVEMGSPSVFDRRSGMISTAPG